MSTPKQPVFKSDEEKNAYRAGLRAGLKPVPTVEQQQRRIAQQIKSSGPVTSTSSQIPPPVTHHPQEAYRNYKATLLEEGIAPNQDFEHWKRSHFGISTDSEHEQSQQQIHKNDIGGKSVQKGIPEHIHDKIVGKITNKTKPPIPSAGTGSDDKPAKGTPDHIPDRQQGKTKPPIPSAGTGSNPKPMKGTPGLPVAPKPVKPAPPKTYAYPYDNLPFDPRRVPKELNDPSFSQSYKDRLQQWSIDNFTRYQQKKPLLEKPKPGSEYVDKKTDTLGSENSKTLYQRLLGRSKLVPVTGKTTEYQRTVGKQLPYYLVVDGVRQPKLYNVSGGLYDESGPKITSLGYLNQQEGGVGLDTPEKIKQQGISRGLDLLSVISGTLGNFASKTARATAAINRVKTIARSRAGQLSTRGFGARNPGSIGGLVNRGTASLGRAPARIGELPSSGATGAVVP